MRTFCTLLMLFVCFQCEAQSVISPLHNNVLVRGIPNTLTVGLKGIAADSVELRAEKCTFEKLSMWEWRITPDTSLKSASIILEAWSRNKMIVIDTMYFRLKWLPDPVIYIENKTGQNDSALASRFATGSGIAARGENIDQDVWFRVQSYRMTLSSDTSKHFISNDPYIKPEMIAAIKAAPHGTFVTFDKVMVLYPDKRVSIVQGVRVKIL